MVGPGFPPLVGGVEVVIARLAHELAAVGCQVDVLAQYPPGTMAPDPVEQRSRGVTVRWFRSRTGGGRFQVAPSMVTYLRQNSHHYHIVHAHSVHASPASLAALATDRPMVLTPHYHGLGHTPTAQLLHRLYRPLTRHALARAQLVLPVSAREADLVTRQFAVPPQRIRVVHNGVDVAAIATATPYVDDRPVILVAGRLEEYKQVTKVVQAVEPLRQRVHLVIVGGGPAQPSVREAVDRLSLRDTVSLLGFISEPELRRWQRTARVAVTLSRHEAFGLVLLEAVAAGAHVVASDVPAHREVAGYASRDQVRFVPVDAEPNVITATLQRTLTAPRIHTAPEGIPTWDRIAAQYLQAYSDVLASSRASS